MKFHTQAELRILEGYQQINGNSQMFINTLEDYPNHMAITAHNFCEQEKLD